MEESGDRFLLLDPQNPDNQHSPKPWGGTFWDNCSESSIHGYAQFHIDRVPVEVSPDLCRTFEIRNLRIAPRIDDTTS